MSQQPLRHRPPRPKSPAGDPFYRRPGGTSSAGQSPPTGDHDHSHDPSHDHSHDHPHDHPHDHSRDLAFSDEKRLIDAIVSLVAERVDEIVQRRVEEIVSRHLGGRGNGSSPRDPGDHRGHGGGRR